MNDEIRRLEEKIAFLEHHVTEQDKVMLELAEDVARLRREMKRLIERLAGTEPGAADPSESPPERPPHY